MPAALLLGLAVATCDRGTGLPDPMSPEYAEAVTAFYTAVAAVQVGETGLAEAALRRVTELAPGEPAGWADLGLVALQRRELDEAAARLHRARMLAPEHSGIHLLSALVTRERGFLDSATQYLRRAVELDQRNLKALYLLAQIVEQEAGPASGGEAAALIDRLLAVEPGNLVARLERARLAAQQQDRETLMQALERIAGRAGLRAAGAGAELRRVRAAAGRGDFRGAATQLAFLQTELQSLPAYRDDADLVRTAPGGADVLLTRFLRLPAPTAQPALPDTGLEFVAETLAIGEGPLAWVRALWLSEEVPLTLVAAGRGSRGGRGAVWISSDPAVTAAFALPGTATGVAPLDYDYDFRVDLALAGPGGMRLLRQDDAGAFRDVTRTAIPPAVARGAYAGVWAADLDLEGDLDLVLGTVEGPPVVLRNRGDGTFTRREGFEEIRRLRDFVWADWDADGDPDAALLDADGRLHVFLNDRSRVPQFRPYPVPDTLGSVRAIAVADWNADATHDLIVLRGEGTLTRLAVAPDGWETEVLGHWPGGGGGGGGAGGFAARLFVADLDNNGDVDLVASAPGGTQVWLRTSLGLRPHASLGLRITDVADLSGEGRLDLFGISPDGAPRWLANRGTKDYYSAVIRPRAAAATGDRRINPFGIGGEIEVRAGLLYRKQAIQGPAVHFGLGEHPAVHVARIIWPNGSVQAEFNLAAINETILTRQRLKGSCPWVFAFDGEEMQFVTDFLWRTALGLRINAQGEAAVIHSEDWVRIRGDQLAARDGFYDVRITAELWETHFFDHIALMAVDHPAGTEAFVDERFTLPAPDPAVHLLGPLRPVAGAWDQQRRDVTDLVRALDGRFLDTFELGPYQGIATDHYVEVAVGDEAPTRGPLWLVASGWVYPTDASINVAASQGDRAPPRGVRLEVPDGTGGWATVEADLGFPGGKTKTMLIPLEGVFRAGTERRVRLRTNMEIYWDRIAWAAGRPDVPVATRRLLPSHAALRYRGFSAVEGGRREPEWPDYGTIAAVVPQWRDLVGYYTRFGDVRVLIEAIDDRYVIMNAGDELALRFPALPPPPRGWTRDFVLVGDGWVKDGDYNTGFSTTVLPLPYHGLTTYGRAPGRLEDDPAYRRHPEDWTVFHTRYVTSRAFHHALVPDRPR
ncbi:MAG: FG-GAP-like repeat-containing protein [Gemmatimonadales bacterium]